MKSIFLFDRTICKEAPFDAILRTSMNYKTLSLLIIFAILSVNNASSQVQLGTDISAISKQRRISSYENMCLELEQLESDPAEINLDQIGSNQRLFNLYCAVMFDLCISHRNAARTICNQFGSFSRECLEANLKANDACNFRTILDKD